MLFKALCETPCTLCLCGKKNRNEGFTTETQGTRSFTEKYLISIALINGITRYTRN